MSRDGDATSQRDMVGRRPSDFDDEPPTRSLEAVENRLDALSTQVATLRDQLEQAQTERADLREEVAHLQAENGAFRRELDQLDARTDLLELVETVDTLDGKQRSVALIQHLRRAAQREHERDRLARASVTRQEAEAALHHPDVDRTTIYDDMRRAVRLVGDENILWYESSSGGASRLKLDLGAGDLPAGILGQRTRQKRR